MQHDNDPDDNKPPPPSTATSFVYPTRSLLSRGIQPAFPIDLTSHDRSIPVSQSSRSADRVESTGASGTPTSGPPTRRKSVVELSGASLAPPLRPRSSDDLSSLQPSHDDEDKDRPISSPETRHASRKHRQRRVQSPNFRDYPADGGSRGFSTVSQTSESSSSPPLTGPFNFSTPLLASGPSGEPVPVDMNDNHSDDFNPHWPPHFAEAASQAFADTSSAADMPPVFSDQELRASFDVTDTGIVHLPARPSSNSPSMTYGSSGRSVSGMSSSVRSAPLSSKHAVVSYRSGGRSLHAPSSRTGGSGAVVSRETTSPDPSTDPSNQMSSNQASGSLSSSYQTSEEPYVTVRFEHKEDGNGHHIIVGREGKLARCEDEPIRTPGAVQSFGVLIAVQENLEDETLLVRQVSENSTELLGLSPRYLFSLPCFTEVLPDSQVDVLWDNIQYLTDPDMNLESEDDSPHVFTLSGWGEPGSAKPGTIGADELRRAKWSCWCAAHRPKPQGNGPAGAGNLIILEFELERDVFNPLYPSPVAAHVLSGMSSPTSNSAASNSSTDTSGTLVSDFGQLTEPDFISSLTVTDMRTSSTASESAAQTAMSRTSSEAISPTPHALSVQNVKGLEGDDDWEPSAEAILDSTTNHAKPLLALERIRKMNRSSPSTSPSGDGSGTRSRRGGRRGPARGPSIGMMDVFAVMAQINEQLAAAADLDSFLNIVVGVIKDLTQFHRVLVYQFDEAWNGQTVAELVDWNQSHDLYKGLHFPASDIPAQARELYTINKMRLLYDREQTTARIVVRNKQDLETPLNMTYCYLRAMSPIHLKYLGNMGVRSSMSLSIVAFGQLWGLVACHSYGAHGIRVSFPVRQMLRLLSDSISRNIERLSYAQRLYTRKLFNTMTQGAHPTGYIVSNANDLLGLFDADFGVLVIGEGAKILGPNQHGQEVLVMAEYLRLKQFDMIQISQAVTKDFPDLQLSTGLEIIAGLLYVPLSSGGRDFIAFLRKGQPRAVRWAGKPHKDGAGEKATLEPRKSFKVWSETVAGRCRAWTDEQVETAGVLALVYGKFIEVWRQKESALQTTKLTNLLLSNAGHEVRTPLNHIINCLELALNGKLDLETRENLHQSHAASKSLLFTINDLLDLTRLESGNETSFQEPFDLPATIEDATNLYRTEAIRRGLEFRLDTSGSPGTVVGDSNKIRTVVANLTANALKSTQKGSLEIICRAFEEPEGLRDAKQVAVEIIVGDTGCGIPGGKLESIFREFEQVESAQPKTSTAPGLGLGLAVVARIVEQLGGQLRVDSKVDEGSRFSFLIPFALWDGSESPSSPSSLQLSRHGTSSRGSSSSREVDNLVDALSTTLGALGPAVRHSGSPDSVPGTIPVTGMGTYLRPVKKDGFDLGTQIQAKAFGSPKKRDSAIEPLDSKENLVVSPKATAGKPRDLRLRVLIVEDNGINRMILAKRLSLDGHTVISTTNGQEGVDKVLEDPNFDCILMDVQMPILNGFEATERIRKFEASSCLSIGRRLSHSLNGRMPIFAVSASLLERQRDELQSIGIDGWILKPIDFGRLNTILHGVVDEQQRRRDEYHSGSNWEAGGWLPRPVDP